MNKKSNKNTSFQFQRYSGLIILPRCFPYYLRNSLNFTSSIYSPNIYVMPTLSDNVIMTLKLTKPVLLVSMARCTKGFLGFLMLAIECCPTDKHTHTAKNTLLPCLSLLPPTNSHTHVHCTPCVRRSHIWLAKQKTHQVH